MVKKSNIFSFFALFILACVTANAQETTVTVSPAPQPKGNFQVFTNGGGSYLGVQLQEVSKENFSKFGLREVRGVAVEKVTENSPASQAGLQNGDVIVRFEGEEVSSVRKLQRLIGEVAPDHQSKVIVLREGKEREVTVIMGKRPGLWFQTASISSLPALRAMPNVTMPAMPAMPDMPPMPNNATIFSRNADGVVFNFSVGRSIGVGTSSLTKQLGDYFGVADGKGILISSVNENSPAAKGGLKAGDVIVEADGKAVANSMELMKVLNAKEKGSVTLTVIRNKNRQTVTVEPEERKTTTFDNKITPKGAITLTPQTPLNITTFPIDM